jgi:hypothetical protein
VEGEEVEDWEEEGEPDWKWEENGIDEAGCWERGGEV